MVKGFSPLENLPQYTSFFLFVTKGCDAERGATRFFFPGGTGPALSLPLRVVPLLLVYALSEVLDDLFTYAPVCP